MKQPSPADRHVRIAVFPVENKSAARAPLQELRKSMVLALKARGVEVASEEAVEEAMARHRIRYAGGLDAAAAAALRTEAGADAVLVTSLELYDEAAPPRISLLARLVSTGSNPEVLWSDSVGLAGNDAPGLLGLGLISDPKVLREKAADALMKSLASYAAGAKAGATGGRKSFAPKVHFRSAGVGADLLENYIEVVDRSSVGVDNRKGPVRIPVALLSPSDGTVTVEFAVRGGTAEEGTEYVVKEKTLAFAPGETLKTIDIEVKYNPVYKDDKTINITLTSAQNALLGSETQHTVTIVNTVPMPSVSFAAASRQLNENGGNATIQAELSSVSGKDVLVPFTVSGTAKTPGNYTITPGPAMIKAGTKSAAITVSATDNGINEDDKTVVVTMGVPKDAAQGKITQSVVTIEDADPLPVAAFAQKESRGEDREGLARIEVRLSAASGKTVTVEYGVAGGTAQAGRDFVPVSGAVTFLPGEQAKIIEVGVRNSGIHDYDKTMEFALTRAVNGTVGANARHTRTIVNTAPMPAVEFMHAQSGGGETERRARIAVMLTPVSNKPATVAFAATGGTAVPRVNYELTEGTLTFAPGERFKAIALNIKDDGVNSDNATVAVGLKSPRNAVLGSAPTHTYTIIEQDIEPAVSFTTARMQAQENGGSAAIVVELTAPSGKDVLVPFTVSGTAKTPGNYTIAANPVVIKAGATSASIMVSLSDNGLNEDDKTVVVTMGVPMHAAQGKITQIAVTIVDADPLPIAAFTQKESRGEDREGPARIEVLLDRASGKTVTVEYGTAGGSAQNGSDYAPGSGVVTFLPGELSKIIETAVQKSGIYDYDKTIELALTNAVNGTVGANARHTRTIVNTAPMPVVEFMHPQSSVDEGAQAVALWIKLDAASGRPVTVEYAVTGGTATAQRDYAVKGSAVIFQPGETIKTIELDTRANGLNEDDKTVEIGLKNPKNAQLGATSGHRLIIRDTDPEPRVSFGATSREMKENDGAVTLPLELSALSGKDVLVPFTVSGTAKSPGNYTITPGPVVIKAGTKNAGITVSAADNGINEDDKTVVVTMGVPTHAALGKITQSAVTIADADPPPVAMFTRKESRGDDRTGPARIEVRLNTVSGKTVTVEYGVTGGTATGGKDYAQGNGVLTFLPNEQAKAIELPVKSSGVYGADRTMVVSLLRANNAALGREATHTYTIVNTVSLPSAAFTASTQRLKKNAGTVHVTVQLSARSARDVTVPFTVSGSAVKEKDYSITPSPVVVPAGAPGAELSITLKEGDPVEEDQTIDIKLEKPDAALPGLPNFYRLVIAKDARPTIAVLPFFNASTKKDAGDILMLQFVKELKKLSAFSVIEPGILRETLLKMRVIMVEGVSSSDVELITHNIDADLIVTGKVFDYKDAEASLGKPKVNFSVMLISRSSKKIVWASDSVNSGDDALLLFNWGEVNTASAMVTEMVRVVLKNMLAW